ncbi:acyltransferase [Flavobacterium sp. ZS1P70]|uniref:Acyltransferase n=1 Tax=Flavobacterium zhoui TaxID=3230414 RepID=A0ABW6I721_9FLAO
MNNYIKKSSSFLSELRLYLCNHFISNIPSHTIRLLFYREFMSFNIGKGSSIFMGCKFDCARGLTIGVNSVINARCRLDSRGGLIIGDNVSISEDVIILTADHDMDAADFAGRNKNVIIEDYAWIGTRAMILPGINTGKGAVIAAGSVVTKNVNAFQVVAGVPAKFIKMRNQNLEYKNNYKRLFQ